jgi:adenylate cyclase class 2
VHRVRPLYYNGSAQLEKAPQTPVLEGKMPHEIEIKVHVKDLNAFRIALKRLGARSVSGGTGRVHEWNVLFDTPQRELAGREELLRIRTETPERSNSKRSRPKVERVLLTFKRPIGGEQTETGAPGQPPRHKIREEIELEVADARALAKILKGLGLCGWFRYEKFRTTFRLPAVHAWAKGLLIELDETPIGIFVELEGPPTAIDRAANALGFAKQDYIVMNYLSLYLAECRRRGEQPSDLVFKK